MDYFLRHFFILIVTSLIFLSPLIQAKEGVPTPEPLSEYNENDELPVGAGTLPVSKSQMLGNWSKTPTLKKLGIEPKLIWVSDLLGNPIGGVHHGFREFDNLFFGLDVDLEKFMGAPKTKFFTSMSQRSGTSLTRLDIKNTFNVSQVCCGPTYRLVDLYLEQPFFDNRFNIRFGRLATGDEFLSSPLYWLFVQNGIDGNPVGIFKNAPGMSAYPRATWAIRALVQTVPEKFYVMGGVYNGDPALGENSKHGVDFSMRGPLFAIGEFGYRSNQNNKSSELPGNYKVGIFYDNSLYHNFLFDEAGRINPLTGFTPKNTRGNTGYYLLMDQMFYRENKPEKQGATAFFSFVYVPDQSISTMPIFINGGVIYQGLLPRRLDDIAGLAVIYGSFSKDLRRSQMLQNQNGALVGVQYYETVIEAMYLIQATGWLKIQPDLQYIIKPGGTGTIPNALVLGAQVAVTI